MEIEPVLYISPTSRKTHIVGDSINRTMCGITVDKINRVLLARLNVDFLAQDLNLCGHCKATSTRLYLGWVNSITEEDILPL